MQKRLKIILSRKGFDQANGGCASPIMPDGTLLSMPIPSAKSGVRYNDLRYGALTYEDIWKQLKPKRKVFSVYCHLDPDIRVCAHTNLPNDLKPIFGQMGAAQTHLYNQHVTEGDLFLFFGWFRQTHWDEKTEMLRYVTMAPNQHILYGYLQVGEVVTGDDVQKYPWHPHADSLHIGKKQNTMYLPTPYLCINGRKTELPGAGTFKFSKELVLTKEGMSRGKWDLPVCFQNVSISCHNKNSFKDGYFQSAPIGQEFVVEDKPEISDWALHLVEDNAEPYNIM